MNSTVPKGWRLECLGSQVGKITSGGTPKAGRADYYGGDIPFLKIDDITSVKGRYVLDSKQTVTGKALKESSAKLFPAGTVVTTMYGTIGATAILSKPMATNQAIAAFLELQGFKADYLQQLLSYEAPKLVSSASQTTQANISGAVLKEFEVLVPPFSEQKEIAAILSSVDDMIEKTRAQIDKIKDLKAGLMQELLTEGIGHAAFKDSPVGRIPEGWLIREVQEILESIIDYRGKSPPKSEKGVPLITAKNIRQGYIDAEPREFIFEEQYDSWMVRGTPKEGDVFITTEAPLGNVAKVPGYKFAIGQRVLALCPSSIVDTDYLLYVMQGQYFREQLDLQSTGSTVAGIKQSTFRKILLAVPPLEEQKEIVKPMNALLEREELSEKKLDSLLKLKKALMQDLLTGKVRVNVDNKENAVA